MTNPNYIWNTPGSEIPPERQNDPNSETRAIPMTPTSEKPGTGKVNQTPSSTDFQSIRLPQDRDSYQRPRRQGCGCLAWMLGLLLVIIGVYFLAPFDMNMVLMGIDRAPEGTAVGRSDTIIIVGIHPLNGKIKMLSIPRDLWIEIPNVGENRINTVHFFAEADEPGSGPAALLAVIRDQFGVDTHYYARIQLENFPKIIDALGGVTLELSEPASIYEAGTHHLSGDQALAFVRDRNSTDDFFRMAHGQLLLKAIVKQVLLPSSWKNLPAAYVAMQQVIETNVPTWMWPRLGLAVIRSVPDGIENRTLTRDEVTPFTTNMGANVLLPQWDKILPIVEEMFVN